MSLLSFLSDFLAGSLAGSSAPLRGPAGVRLPRIGAIYRRVPDDGPDQYAEVIGLRTDDGGIRHVRFELILGYRDKFVRAGERTLSSVSFARRFPERLEFPDEGADDGKDGETTRA